MVFAGNEPITAWLNRDLLALDQYGFIKTDENMATNIPGIFAAGDVRAKLLRQTSTAVGDGSLSCFSAAKFLEEQH